MHLSNIVEHSHKETQLHMVSTENFQVKHLPKNTDSEVDTLRATSTWELEEQSQDLAQSSSATHPIQKIQAFILYGVTAADALALMIYVPLLTDFCKQRLHISDSRVGAAVGIIMGSYNLANTISSPKIGDLSDQFGRRPLILFGVASSILFTSLFPFVENFYLAVLIRLGAGFCNSNNAVSRAYISDLTLHARGIEEEAERAALFGYLGAVWALARSISSSTAGLLTGIHIRFLPSFIADNPFAAPGLAASAFLILIFILAFFFLKESHPCPKELPGWKSIFRYRSLPNEDTVLETEMETRTSETSFSLEEKSGEKDSSHILHVRHARFISKLIYLFHYGGSILIRLLIANALHQFANGSFLVVLVLYLSLEISRGGVGLDPRGVGIVYAFFGLIGLLFQLIWFRRCVRRWGLRRTYQLGTLLLATGSFTVLCCNWIANQNAIESTILFWPLLLCFVSPQGIGFMCGLPVMGTLLANASPADIQGLCQGTAQSSGSIARTLGPMSSGFLFSWAVASQNGPFPVFLLLSCCYMICFGIACSLPESIEHAVQSS
ncbi:hypothetical protein GpartN1_g6866.t1 [Galdieria partita]|uniref:Major facilitator superfamily (MFS) profile domain-containing protein n=1 Tax=Galdieria partita TaxID=83374 RepID=A0A9C7Q383_9RHOD|nr:hypothetical protein GpartN1_g6866.t1 [Galdieria partita]